MELPDFLHVQDGVIRLVGHRIGLLDVVARYEEGRSPEGIVLDVYPTLGLAHVYKVIGFYLENEEEVRELMRVHQEAIKRIEAEITATQKTPTLEEMRRRMKARLEAGIR